MGREGAMLAQRNLLTAPSLPPRGQRAAATLSLSLSLSHSPHLESGATFSGPLFAVVVVLVGHPSHGRPTRHLAKNGPKVTKMVDGRGFLVLPSLCGAISRALPSPMSFVPSFLFCQRLNYKVSHVGHSFLFPARSSQFFYPCTSYLGRSSTQVQCTQVSPCRICASS